MVNTRLNYLEKRIKNDMGMVWASKSYSPRENEAQSIKYYICKKKKV